MTILGTVRNGVIVYKSRRRLPEGSTVRIETVKNSAQRKNSDAPLAGLAKKLRKISGSAKGLPSDLADNHDYYLHGLPKRKL